MIKYIAAVAILGIAAPALAQDRAPFTGPSVGVEGGYLEHHFALEFEATDAQGQLLSREDRYYRAHGLGGGAFAGYDIAISKRGRLGAEFGVSAGGRTNTATFGGASYAQVPRYGAHLAVRAGYAVTPRLMGYALTGYGGNRYRIRDGLGIGDENAGAAASSSARAQNTGRRRVSAHDCSCSTSIIRPGRCSPVCRSASDGIARRRWSRLKSRSGYRVRRHGWRGV